MEGEEEGFDLGTLVGLSGERGGEGDGADWNRGGARIRTVLSWELLALLADAHSGFRHGGG